MNYARSLVNLSSRQYAIGNIQSQAQLELGRNLSHGEETLLKSKYSVEQLSTQIYKVCDLNCTYFHTFIYLVWMWYSKVCSMALPKSRTFM